MFGYKYLWVQIVAMMLGLVVLACIAKQTTNSGERTYGVFWRELHPSLAILWAVSALVATILWHIPQYSLTANGLITLAEGLKMDLDYTGARIGMGAIVLTSAAYMVYVYHSGRKGLKIYENAIKVLIWLIVAAFGIAAFTGEPIAWKELFKGLFGITFLVEGFEQGVALKPVVAALAAAVGINMIFLYPYSLLERGWGKEHKELAYVDLLSGMAFPFIVATSLMIIAVAKTLGPEPGVIGTEAIRDVRQIIPVLSASLGDGMARLIVGLGVTAIGFSTITTHMLAAGFIGCEMFGMKHEGKAKWMFSFLPAIGVIGVVIKFPIPLAITASTLAMPLMPVTVLCFMILLNRRSYMGEAMPEGKIRILWNVLMTTAIVIMTAAAYYAIQNNWASLQGLLS
ncbi:MAG: hypothetical protein E2O84_01330 [Bacteroidetes bacterium]|nr:MAG: hypothetical protein E2O84_01330 [Bacteroidota bacterium]